MEKIAPTDRLRTDIQLLKSEQAVKEKALREQFFLSYESLKPVNLLNSTLKDIASSPYLIENIVGNGIGLATGYLSKKIVVGASGNIIRRLIGTMLQFGVTNLIAKHPDTIISFGQSIIQHIFRKKETNPKSRDK